MSIRCAKAVQHGPRGQILTGGDRSRTRTSRISLAGEFAEHLSAPAQRLHVPKIVRTSGQPGSPGDPRILNGQLQTLRVGLFVLNQAPGLASSPAMFSPSGGNASSNSANVDTMFTSQG